MSVGRITSEQFRQMGVTTKDGSIVTLEEHIRRCFAGVYDESAPEWERIFSKDRSSVRKKGES